MWMKLLTEAVARTSRNAVAEEIGVSRTTISLVLAEKYPAKTDKIAALVIDTYGKVNCPALGEEITLSQCKKHHESAPPTSSPRAMRHWRACQTCEHNSARKE